MSSPRLSWSQFRVWRRWQKAERHRISAEIKALRAEVDAMLLVPPLDPDLARRVTEIEQRFAAMVPHSMEPCDTAPCLGSGCSHDQAAAEHSRLSWELEQQYPTAGTDGVEAIRAVRDRYARALSRRCPTCGAAPGVRCTSVGDLPHSRHAAREMAPDGQS